MYKKCEEILKELEGERKIKVWWDFKFPEKEKLKLRLKDMLEDEVDEKYYLSDVQIDRIKATNYVSGGYAQRVRQLDGICNTLAARDWKDPKCVQVGELDIKGQDCIKRIYSDNGLSPTLTNMQGGNRQPKVLIKKAKHQQDLTQSQDDICRTIPAGTHGSTPHLLKTIINNNPLRIRKLTPLECWRLQGFDDQDFYKAKERLNNTFYKGKDKSNTQLYKQAGNSITVNVLEKIFLNLF